MSARRVFEGQTTRKEVKRNERKGERGVCRIQKRIGTVGNQGYETVGSGSLIKHQINRQWKSKYFIVTTKEVFRGNFDVKNYRVDFVKSKSKSKTIELHGAVVAGEIWQNSSGLALMPLDSHSSFFRHGLFKKKCGILKHRPFEVIPFNNEDTRGDAFSDGLCCHMVTDDARSFGVKAHEITRDLSSASGQFNVVINQLGHVFPLGAPILLRNGTKWSTVGVFPSATDTSFVPIWLSRENIRSELFFRAGEAVVSTSEVDSVVHTESSTPSGTLQAPPNSSNGTHSTVLDQSRNGQNADEEQTPEVHGENDNQNSRGVASNEPGPADVGTVIGGSPQPRISSQFKIGNVVDNATLMDELARCLDREYRVLKYWKHLAWELNIPPDTQKKFEIYFELSPTVHLFQFLSTSNPRLTIGKLRVTLKDIHRNDLIQELKDFSDAATVVGVFDDKPSLLDSIALKLDSAKKPVGNWRSLATKLISSGQEFKEFEAQLHSSENPTALLFRYLSKHEEFNQLTVGDLKGHLKNVKRNDILMDLDEVQDLNLLADVFSPDSELLNRVSILLNKKTPGVKNWRNLAFLLGVPNKVYEEFDPDSNSPKRSPTKMMLEWLKAEHPDMTVDELRAAVKKIKRGDALEILDGYLFNSQGIGIEIQASSGGEQYLTPKSTPQEQKQKVNIESRQTGSDEVDNGLPSLQSPSKSQRETRLSTAVTELPLRVYSKICLKLNIRSVFFSDFRMFGEKVGLSRDEVEFLGQQVNPTDHILKKWSASGQATVKKFLDILAEEGLGRNDIIKILEDWVNEENRSK